MKFAEIMIVLQARLQVHTAIHTARQEEIPSYTCLSGNLRISKQNASGSWDR